MKFYIREAGKKAIRNDKRRITGYRTFYQAHEILSNTGSRPAKTERRCYWSREEAAQAVREVYGADVEIFDKWLWF